MDIKITSNNLLVSQLKNKVAQLPHPLRLFLQVKSIVASTGEHPFAYGIDLATEEIIKIRLNTIDEGIDDLIKSRKMSRELAMRQVKQQYAGANSRDSLITKRDKYHATYLSFDRCVEIESTEFGIKAYRSHWAELMSADPQAEVIFSLAHIHRRVANELSQHSLAQKSKPDTAWVEMIEKITDLHLGQLQLNREHILAGLNPVDEQGRPWEGYVVLQVHEQDELQSEIKIFQHRKPITHTNSSGQGVPILQTTSAEDSLSYYFDKIIASTHTEFNITRDIARIILNAFCGYPINATQFCNTAPDYLASLRQLYQRFKDRQLNVRIITIRTVLFGPHKIRSLLASNPKKGPLSLYQDNLFLTTVVAIQRYADSGRAFAVFALPAEQVSGSKPSPLSILPIDMTPYAYRHIVIEE